MAETAEQTQVKKFAVIPEKCIACASCWEAFPDTFFEGPTGKAVGIDTQPLLKHDPMEVTQVCPTDAITFGGVSPRESAAKATGKYGVLAQNCVSCGACWKKFDHLFEEKDGLAVAKEDQKPKTEHPLEVILTCPTQAITYSAKLPDLAGPEGLLKEKAGWEAEWAKNSNKEDLQIERERRYGKVYSIEEKEDEGYTLIRIETPQRLPNVRDKYRYGLPDQMPNYATTVSFEGNRLVVRAWLTDPKIRAALTFGSSFPDRFSLAVDFPGVHYGFRQRYDAHNLLEIVVFTKPEVDKNFVWRSHYITEKCVGCTICERVCPTRAITGRRNEMFYIDPKLCINCSVCGVYCPYDAIDDNKDVLVPRIKAKEIPKARVIDELCTGCEFCVDVCPFDCIHMELAEDGFNRLARVEEQPCVSCKLCEQVCIKGAIVIDRFQDFPADTGFSYQPGA